MAIVRATCGAPVTVALPAAGAIVVTPDRSVILNAQVSVATDCFNASVTLTQRVRWTITTEQFNALALPAVAAALNRTGVSVTLPSNTYVFHSHTRAYTRVQGARRED